MTTRFTSPSTLQRIAFTQPRLISSTRMTDAEGGAMNLLSDPVTGEMISKSELKRRQKQRQKDAEKAEKAAKAQSEGGAGGAARRVLPHLPAPRLRPARLPAARSRDPH